MKKKMPDVLNGHRDRQRSGLDDGFSGRATIRTTTEQRLKAVEFAKKQVLAKKPYIWGDEGPNAFDCSGLSLRGLSKCRTWLAELGTGLTLRCIGATQSAFH